MSRPLTGGNVAVPLALSGLAGLAALYGIVQLAGGNEGALGRILSNGFCRLILAVGLSAVIYSFLEVHGLLLERRSGSRLGAWVTGRTGALETAAQWKAQRARRLAPLVYVVFALPLLGFLGTVIGISGAIGELGGVFESSDRTEALARVLGELRFAFDTTLVGLAGVLPVALGMTLAGSVGDRVEADLIGASS